jgi:ubiquinone/menaquinone biosynthesis C-methylase UbiE
VGCGPGSISIGFAQILHQGSVTGVDASEDVLERALQLARSMNLNNVTFRPADAYNLPFDENSFDIVHCHALLVHLSDPAKAASARSEEPRWSDGGRWPRCVASASPAA